MTTSTPLHPDARIEVRLADPEAPDWVMVAVLVSPTFPANELDTQSEVQLATSVSSASDEQFFWLVRSCAAFHDIEVVDGTGRGQ